MEKMFCCLSSFLLLAHILPTFPSSYVHSNSSSSSSSVWLDRLKTRMIWQCQTGRTDGKCTCILSFSFFLSIAHFNRTKHPRAKYQPSNKFQYPIVIYDYVNLGITSSLLVETATMNHPWRRVRCQPAPLGVIVRSCQLLVVMYSSLVFVAIFVMLITIMCNKNRMYQ